ncbi:hypothetical protein C8R44DRAFT_879016 [Mycena epipterygia]|nr:hypothetical protein C8R44DRAFT_879016 [Mycena epipterygia]
MRGAPATVMLPFPQLQRYFARTTWGCHLNNLRSASNLAELALEVDDISLPPAITMIALPHLLRLSLSTANLLEYLDTPTLQELYCPSESDYYLSSLFARRPYRLQKLVVFFPASVTDLRGILHSVPTITEIGLSIPAESTDALAGLLTIRNDTTDVGPSLESMTICFRESNLGLTGFGNPDLLVGMVESRWRGGSGRLRSIVVPEAHWILARDERLALFKSQGLELKLSVRWSYYHLDMVPHHLQLSRSSNL